MPDGVCRFHDFLDDCGPGTAPIRIQVAATVGGDRLALDFSGTDPQTRSGLDSCLNHTRSYAQAAVKCVTDPYGP